MIFVHLLCTCQKRCNVGISCLYTVVYTIVRPCLNLTLGFGSGSAPCLILSFTLRASSVRTGPLTWPTAQLHYVNETRHLPRRIWSVFSICPPPPPHTHTFTHFSLPHLLPALPLAPLSLSPPLSECKYSDVLITDCFSFILFAPRTFRPSCVRSTEPGFCL